MSLTTAVILIIRLKEDFIIVTRRRYDPKRKLHPNCRYAYSSGYYSVLFMKSNDASA
jgi:hypothetical protein